MSDTSAGDTTIAMTPHERAERDIDVVACRQISEPRGHRDLRLRYHPPLIDWIALMNSATVAAPRLAVHTESTGADTLGEEERKAVDAVRFLAADAVERAQSGHPGTPMALAPLAYSLYTRWMRHDPADPSWFDRDRLVLSIGHASTLLYASLHLAGYEIGVR